MIAAFPRPLSKLGPEEVSSDQEGMSLRDYFAGQVLAGNNSFYEAGGAKEIAERAYEVADAMLKEREKTS